MTNAPRVVTNAIAPGYILISLPDKTWAMVREIATERFEAGGILIGERRGAHLRVVDLTFPGPGDLRERYRFVRRCVSHQKQLDELWRKSGKILTWLGEWHTHPGFSANPSEWDQKASRCLVRGVGAPLAFWILGAGEFSFTLVNMDQDAVRYEIVETSEHGVLLAAIDPQNPSNN